MPSIQRHRTLFKNGNGIIVRANGPGRLHLFSGSHQPGVGNVAGFTETRHDTTRFLISFSHCYNRFVFYWDGNGEAVYETSDSLVRLPVGRSWVEATEANRDTGVFSTINIAREASVQNRSRTVLLNEIIPK